METSNKNDEIIKWINTWQKASISLKEIKKKELRDPDYYEKHLNVIDEMLQYACDHSTTRFSSGLVEQQRLFMKLKDKIISGEKGEN